MRDDILLTRLEDTNIQTCLQANLSRVDKFSVYCICSLF